MSDEVSFHAGLAYAAEKLFVAASPDDAEAYSPYTVWYVYVADDPDEPWTHFVSRWWGVAAAVFRPVGLDDWALVGLSNEGEVDFTFADEAITEKIPGAGVHAPDAQGWGYMSSLKQIGEHLYACGGGGQVYRREGPGQWVHMDDGLLQSPGVSDRLLPRAIDGPHEQAIYLVGAVSSTGLPPFVYFWNGQAWRARSLPGVAERITHLLIESESRVWLCGANGTLLQGNAHDGFRSLSTVNDNQLFLSMAMLDGRLYLASNLGLHVYDPSDPAAGIRVVRTGLSPELQDANVLSACDGVLWSIGPKDLARFDGQRWERVRHPDNPPIGQV